MLRAEMSSTMELVVPLLCLVVLSCSGSTSAAGAESSINRWEGSDVTLSCTIPVDPTKPAYKHFVWKKDGQKEVYAYDGGFVSVKEEQFRDRVSFSGKLEEGSASITITNTKVADTGNYTCESGSAHKKEVRIYLRVGAAPEPYVTILNQTNSWALLRCVVRGASPKPKVEWQDSDGNILQAERPQVTERGGRYDVILQTTVTKTDHYRCVATQEEIKHQINGEIYVFLGGPTGHSTGVVVGLAVPLLIVCCLLAVQHCRRKMKSQSNSG